MSIHIVVDSTTGRYLCAFTERKYALDSIALSYSRVASAVLKIVHEDVWNLDVEIARDKLTVKRVEPKDFVEHL